MSGQEHSMLAPVSDAAATIENLWWLLFAVCLTVFVVVIGLYLYAALRRRRSADAAGMAAAPADDPAANRRAQRIILIAGGALPAAILVGLTAATVLTTSRSLEPAGADALEVEVIGHQYWWEVRYPGTSAVTANEIHLPTDRPTRLRLRSADVIHSFWVPQLHGKLDMTPGRTGELVVRPREAGVYRGFCAEFCGAQHALMGLVLVAQPPDSFAVWLEAQARPAASPTDERAIVGEAVFARRDCALCHVIRGARTGPPPAEVGPDLTHVASRRTLGAATVVNSTENLRAWIEDPHRLKPGVRMPASELPDSELDALVAYLAGLR